MTGGHHRQPFQRHQAREWQRAVLDTVGKQQFDAVSVLAEHLALALETVAGGTAEQMAFQRHQLQGRGAIGADHRRLQLLVGIRERGLQHPFELSAGVPGATCADCTKGHDDSKKHAC
ncbi:hypothetical protein D3C78_954290 [compost metagenome]